MTPRSTLFTPCKTVRGPSTSTKLASMRMTSGRTVNGEELVMIDNWAHDGSAHARLGFRWTGVAKFAEVPGEHAANTLLAATSKIKPGVNEGEEGNP